jgi:glycosyltransferase involved in cell wall biosynthesis
MNKLVSIIVPIYNVEKYLHRCVHSILKQTYRNIEIILVDDGSPDRCGEMCDEYASLDKRVKVIHKENGGLSDARNMGINISRGCYISFIDSDDWIHEKYIEILVDILEKGNADISVCGFLKTSVEDFTRAPLNEHIFEFTNIEALEQLYGEFSTQLVVAWGKLLKKSLLQNIRFPIGRLHEDVFTTYKIIYEAKKVVFTTNQLLYYWQREESITGGGLKIRNLLDVLDALDQRAEFFMSNNLKELVIKTYRSMFFMFMAAFEQKNMNENDKAELYNQFERIKKKLRATKQSNKFNIIYELFFIFPKPVNVIYKTYRKLRY